MASSGIGKPSAEGDAIASLTPESAAEADVASSSAGKRAAESDRVAPSGVCECAAQAEHDISTNAVPAARDVRTSPALVEQGAARRPGKPALDVESA